MKACEVYKKKNGYKIVTSYQVDVGRYVSRPPVFILPISATVEDLRTSIFTSLKESKKITYDDYYSGPSSKNLLKELKEPSFPKLYKSSKSCMVYLKDSLIEIVPYRCEDPNEGLLEVSEEIIKIPYTKDNEQVIVGEILKVLSAEY